MNPYFWNGLYLSVGISLLVTIVITFFLGDILLVMKTPDNLLPMAHSYLTIIMLGQIMTILYNYFAAVLSQLVSAGMCGWWLFQKMDVIHIEERGFSPLHMKKMAMIGIPMGLEHSVTYIGAIVLRGVINSFGSVAVAAQVCGEKIRRMITLPFEGVGLAMATYTGQNYGAGRTDRIKKGINSGLVIQTAYGILAFLVIGILKKPMVSLLLGETVS